MLHLMAMDSAPCSTPPLLRAPHLVPHLTAAPMLLAAQIVIGSIWIFHGLYSKLLRGIPRHRAIVARVLSESRADVATTVIGLAEILLGVWVFTGWQRVPCATVQTLALVAMNTLEIALAADLLISAIGMVALNSALLAMVWFWALSGRH